MSKQNNTRKMMEIVDKINSKSTAQGKPVPFPMTQEGLEKLKKFLNQLSSTHTTSNTTIEDIKYIKRDAGKLASFVTNIDNKDHNKTEQTTRVRMKNRINWRWVTKIITIDNTQAIILLLTALILLFMLLYPPFEAHGVRGLVYDLGYSFIFEPPRKGGIGGGVNTELLGLQSLITISISSLIYFSLGHFKRK
jgi:hypothetical protein